LKNFSYVGRHQYFLTFCTHEAQPLFAESSNVDLVRDQLVRTAAEHGVAVHAYCFMKEHVHALLAGLEDTTDLRAFMNTFKQRSGWAFKRDRRGRLWQGSYYDHVLREEEGTAGVLAYIVNNPVSAGLVVGPLEYPYWGSLTHTREEIVALITGVAEWKPGSP
jgi:putative transposase